MTSHGTVGDLRPMVAVAGALCRRGHAVTFVAHEWFRRDIEGVGARFVAGEGMLSPVAIAGDARFASPFSGSLRFLVEGAAGAAGAGYVQLNGLIERDGAPDVMVGHHVSVHGPWSAERAGVPWVTCAMAPTSWISAEQWNVYPGMPDRDRPPLPGAGMRVVNRLGAFATDRRVDPAVNRVRAGLGLPAMSRVITRWMLDSAAANLGMWSPSFRPSATDDPARSVVCGFAMLDGRAGSGGGGNDDHVGGLPHGLLEFLEVCSDRGDALVLFSLGTSLSHRGSSAAGTVREVCERLGVRGVLLGVDETTAARVNGAEGRGLVFACGFAPHELLMPRCAAVVHHGGIGSTARTLMCGMPGVVTPVAHDQFDNASRCRRLGVSRVARLRGTGGRGDADRLAQALRGVLDDSGVRERASGLAERLRAERRGEEVAADEIERVGQCA